MAQQLAPQNVAPRLALDSLPTDVIIRIFCSLNTKDILNVSETCPRFHALCMTPWVWGTIKFHVEKSVSSFITRYSITRKMESIIIINIDLFNLFVARVYPKKLPLLKICRKYVEKHVVPEEVVRLGLLSIRDVYSGAGGRDVLSRLYPRSSRCPIFEYFQRRYFVIVFDSFDYLVDNQ